MHIPWLIIEIAIFRRGPQSLPGSLPITVAALGIYAFSGVVVQRQIAPEMASIPPVLLDLSLSVVLVVCLLWFRGFVERFPQTATALAGTGTLLTLCGLPVIRLLQAGGDGGVAALAGVALWLALVCWSLFVTAHILRHSLEISFAFGVALAMAFLFASALLYGYLFEVNR